MTVWEIVILMVVGSACIAFGIGFVYSSIVNTVERYQIRKAKRELDIYSKVMEELPKLFARVVDIVGKSESERNKRYMEKYGFKTEETKETDE